MLQKFKMWAEKLAAKTLTVSTISPAFLSINSAEFKTAEEFLKAGAQKVWASFKACDITANVVVSTPFTLTRKGSTTPIEIDRLQPDLARILRYPNEQQTWGDLLYVTSLYLKWIGNAYWLKSEANLTGDRPKQIYSLNASRVRVKPDRDGNIEAYYYHTSRGVITLAPEDVLHFKRPHPLNDYYGIGDLEAGEALIEDAYNRIEYQKAFWKNGAAPSGVMVCEENAPTTDAAQWEKMQREWNAKFQGRTNAGKIAWMAGKWRYERIGLTAQEMDDIERLKLSRNDIFLLHGVPLSVAGVESAANFATADIDNQTFRSNTVAPLVKIIYDTVQTDIIAGFDEKLIITPNISGLVNRGKVITDLMPLFTIGGLSINEFRKEVGLTPVAQSWADQHYITSAFVPVDLAGVANAQATEETAKHLEKDFIRKALTNPKPEN